MFLWDTGDGYPHNVPLWFVRNLIVLVLVSPFIFQYVKKFKQIGIIALLFIYLCGFWISAPGFECIGFFFFSIGAFFSIHQTIWSNFFSKFGVISAILSFFLLVLMIVLYNTEYWDYLYRTFTISGTYSLISLTMLLKRRNVFNFSSLLSDSSFFIYATHGTIVLPIVRKILQVMITGESQIILIIDYFASALITIALLVCIYYLMSRFMPRVTSVLVGGRVNKVIRTQ